MIDINLISPEQKKYLKGRRLYIIIKESVMLFCLFSGLMAIMLIGSKYFLQEQLNTLMEKNSVGIHSNELLNQQIIGVNKKITDAYNVQKGFKKWTIVLDSLGEITPANINYSQIKTYRQQFSIELQGTAATREDLLALQNNLKQSGNFENIDLPLKYLISKNQNNFIIKATISPKVKF
ncbi:MAG: PilN domain-containing protein [Patescibacteria group bacterium]